MPAWVLWAIVAVLLAVGEIFTPGLFFLGPIALAALASTVVAAVGGAVWLQIVVFGVGSVAAVGLLRPIARKHLTMPRAIRTGAAALEGAKAIVLQRVDGRGGRGKRGGDASRAERVRAAPSRAGRLRVCARRLRVLTPQPPPPPLFFL